MSHTPALNPIHRLAGRIGLALASLLVVTTAQADDDDLRVPKLATYNAECASCHVAYPPGLLPAPSWQRLMNNLPRHFGTDASLDAATVQKLSTWLTAHAASYRKVARNPVPPPDDRITRSAWFIHEHQEELPPSVWKRPSIQSPANCAACHTRADQGAYGEHDLRIPR